MTCADLLQVHTANDAESSSSGKTLSTGTCIRRRKHDLHEPEAENKCKSKLMTLIHLQRPQKGQGKRGQQYVEYGKDHYVVSATSKQISYETYLIARDRPYR
jgi:hypothetical protein